MNVLFNSILILTSMMCANGFIPVVTLHQGHKHYKPDKDKPKDILKDKEFLRDYDHIKEDLQELYNKDFSDKLDPIDLEAYYFQVHDLDDDQRLDGLELLAAMNHIMDRQHESLSEKDMYLADNPQIRQGLQVWWNEKFEEDSKFIDEIMKEEDLDGDGYLDYLEYATARHREKMEV
ncbi:multiple coagulation factor deficiency protein 2 homolog [Parasteatoda tepidariorum]|uniref:multiple coagulation factor deficiency protein 2 homolog n=1 Tax=Parasteatoda tepidariorum TaxID=114398 RepID=UPI001C719EC9|nr:multiple coagulation factor deficiency protein 2 homolog [Parasteatoda tepidariorum]XP_015916662.2 multiple coagulation factor deficiency protein 2 homolog [Parasteatoda tepidariorum]